MDFASKDETDIYFFLKDNNFDENVAKLFEGKRRTDGNACSTRKVRRKSHGQLQPIGIWSRQSYLRN